MIKIKRVYQDAERTDGYRVLTDRLWPRGIKKSALKMDEWCKEIAPSSKLRIWFGHKPENWKKFRSQYLKELKAEAASQKLKELAKRAGKRKVTLLYAAKDEKHTHALVLKSAIEKILKKTE